MEGTKANVSTVLSISIQGVEGSEGVGGELVWKPILTIFIPA